MPTATEWGRNRRRIGAVAALVFIAVYGADVAVLAWPETLLGAKSQPTREEIKPRRLWAYVPVAASSHDADSLPDATAALFDRVAIYESLANNDLVRQARKMRRHLRIDLDAVRHNGYVAMPARDLVRWLGGALRWSGTGPAQALTDDGLLVLYPGEKRVQRNYTDVPVPDPPFVSGDDLYLSLAGAAAAFGMDMDRDPASGVYTLARAGREVRVIPREDAFHIEIDRDGRWLQVSYAGHFVKHYRACTGEGQNTPVGQFHIENKSVWPSWRAYWGDVIPGASRRNPLGARFMGTSARGRVTGWTIGIHGTNQPSSIGRRISGGCVRLLNKHAIELYEVIPIGTRVTVHE